MSPPKSFVSSIKIPLFKLRRPWYSYLSVIKMIFVCDKCHFLFSRASQPEQCPDCGKYAVRPANEAERQEYEEHLKEFQEAEHG